MDENKLTEVLGKNIDRFADAVASMGPDAARVYGEMVGYVQIQAVGTICVALFFLVLAIMLIRFALKDGSKIFSDGVEHIPQLAALIIGGLVLIAVCISFGSFSTKLAIIMYPEATVIGELLR